MGAGLKPASRNRVKLRGLGGAIEVCFTLLEDDDSKKRGAGITVQRTDHDGVLEWKWVVESRGEILRCVQGAERCMGTATTWRDLRNILVDTIECAEPSSLTQLDTAFEGLLRWRNAADENGHPYRFKREGALVTPELATKYRRLAEALTFARTPERRAEIMDEYRRERDAAAN